ncbi:hypothetical protein C8J57DRAFT_1235758 [Mycena rebaudengoi]|nr:hypothetical protein C8J57DRAFT_1235758 [Mycena rebaudengoi]
MDQACTDTQKSKTKAKREERKGRQCLAALKDKQHHDDIAYTQTENLPADSLDESQHTPGSKAHQCTRRLRRKAVLNMNGENSEAMRPIKTHQTDEKTFFPGDFRGEVRVPSSITLNPGILPSGLPEVSELVLRM